MPRRPLWAEERSAGRDTVISAGRILVSERHDELRPRKSLIETASQVGHDRRRTACIDPLMSDEVAPEHDHGPTGSARRIAAIADCSNGAFVSSPSTDGRDARFVGSTWMSATKSHGCGRRGLRDACRPSDAEEQRDQEPGPRARGG